MESEAKAACAAAGFDPNEIVPRCNFYDMPGVETQYHEGTGLIVGYRRPRWHFFLEGEAKARSFA
jgi:hypothetical protein